MKRMYLKIIVIVFFINTGYSQGYIHFPDSNAVWSVMTYWNNPSAPPLYWDYWTTHYGMVEDTIINSLVYIKLEKSEDSVFIAKAPTNNYAGAIRRDIPNKRVYFVPADSVNETLIYDFSIDVGDTLIIDNTLDVQTELWCSNIDTIQINEIPYKRFTIYYNYINTGFGNSTYWIEGIGSQDGLLDNYYYLSLLLNEETTELLCFQMDGQLVHHWSYYEGCYQKLDTTASVQLNKIAKETNLLRIIPNPVTDISNVKTGFIINADCIIEIHNINGETLKKSLLKNERKIFRNDFEPGFYLMKVSCGRQVFITKFIVN